MLALMGMHHMGLPMVDMFADSQPDLEFVRRTLASLFGGFGAADMVGCSESFTGHCSAMIGRGQ